MHCLGKLSDLLLQPAMEKHILRLSDAAKTFWNLWNLYSCRAQYWKTCWFYVFSPVLKSSEVASITKVDNLPVAVILCNTCSIGASADNDPDGLIWEVLEYLWLACYTLEFITKVSRSVACLCCATLSSMAVVPPCFPTTLLPHPFFKTSFHTLFPRLQYFSHNFTPLYAYSNSLAAHGCLPWGRLMQGR